MYSNNKKNFFAQIYIVLWIIILLLLGVHIIKIAFSFDVNEFFNISEEFTLSQMYIDEFRILLIMVAIGLFGGTTFITRDFYKSVKAANLTSQAYLDYQSGMLGFEEFQKLVPVDTYKRRFNYTWIFWFTIQPMLSMMLSVVAFLILRSGLGLVSGMSSDYSLQSIYIYMVIVFLSGFSSHKFLAWLDRFSDKIFGHSTPEVKKETDTQMVQEMSKSDVENLKKEFLK